LTSSYWALRLLVANKATTAAMAMGIDDLRNMINSGLALRAATRHDVLLDGEVIVHASRDPEFDAARVLHARGLRGRFRTIDFRTGRPRMELDIGKAARLRTIERGDSGLIVVPYRPMSEEDKTRARLHRARQGRLPTKEVTPDTRQPVKRPGDESDARKRGPLSGTKDDRALVPALAEHEDA
jgi:hypothetical protein